MKNNKKNIITEISRIQEIMYGKSIISEGKITRFADDLADFIKSFKNTPKYTNATSELVSYVDEIASLAKSTDVNKEQKIIDLLNSERANSQLSSMVNEFEGLIYKKMHEGQPDLKDIRNNVETFKNEKNADGTSKYTDEDVNDYIDNTVKDLDGAGKELYVRKLKEEFGIKVDTPTVSTSTTRKLSDDELLIQARQEAATQAASIENKANTEAANIADAATEEEVRAALERFLTYMESTFTGTKIPNKKVLGFFKNANYEFLIKQLRQQVTKTLSDVDKAIDAIPQSKINEFNNLTDPQKLEVLDEVMAVMQRAKNKTPLDKIGRAGKYGYKAYDYISLNFLFKKLNWVSGGTDLSKFSLKRSLRLLFAKFIAAEAFNIAQNFAENTMVLTSDEGFHFDMRIHDLLELDPDTEFFTTPYITNSLLNWGGRTIGFGWNTIAGAVNLIDLLVSTSGEGSKMGGGQPQIQIQYLEDGNVISGVITQEEATKLTAFYKSLFGDSYDESASSTQNFYNILFNSFTTENAIQLMSGTPISGGLNQIREDIQGGGLLYIGKNGVFKITEDGENSYIKALDSSGQEVEIKIKDIFEDKYNRYLGEYKVIPGNEIKIEDYVQFWPTRIEFDGTGTGTKAIELRNNGYGLLVGMGIDEDYNKVKQYLYDKGIIIPPKNIKKYAFYPKAAVDELNPPDDSVDPLVRKYKIPEGDSLGDFLYIVSQDGKVYRIYVASQSNQSKPVKNGGPDNTYIKRGNIYATDGTNNWYPLEYIANKAIEQNKTETTTSTNENLSPKEQFEKDNPSTKLTLIAAIGDLAVYKGSDNKRYKLLEGKIVDINSQK